MATAKLYVGRLSSRISRRDLEDLFSTYGRVVSCEIKHGGYAFLEFDDPRDAEDALNRLNGYTFFDNRISVEWSRKAGGGTANCFICNRSGHWARDCPESNEEGLDVRSGKCFKCGTVGHLARFCRENQRGTVRRGRSPSPPRRRRRSSSPRRSRSPPRRSRSSRSPSPRRKRHHHDSRKRSSSPTPRSPSYTRSSGRKYEKSPPHLAGVPPAAGPMVEDDMPNPMTPTELGPASIGTAGSERHESPRSEN